MKDWIECQSCWAEYRVVSDSDETVQYCPYCGDEIELEEDEDEDEEYDDYND
jgi:predicted RNA-binding Zn-ribbon protein involved in translation (DUF1610 family)